MFYTTTLFCNKIANTMLYRKNWTHSHVKDVVSGAMRGLLVVFRYKIGATRKHIRNHRDMIGHGSKSLIQSWIKLEHPEHVKFHLWTSGWIDPRWNELLPVLHFCKSDDFPCWVLAGKTPAIQHGPTRTPTLVEPTNVSFDRWHVFVQPAGCDPPGNWCQRCAPTMLRQNVSSPSLGGFSMSPCGGGGTGLPWRFKHQASNWPWIYFRDHRSL